MGQEGSTPRDPGDPQTLPSADLPGLIHFIKTHSPRNIVVFAGAGLSTSAGIPDFRSPETGLYNNLASLNLPSPEAVFEIGFFRENPYPFYTLAKELYPGKFKPTLGHAFIALLHRKGMLKMCFTQNIDCLERAAGVPADKIVEAHGSFATQRCIECKTEFPDDMMRKAVEEAEPARCIRDECDGLVKPDIVFFGEALPGSFFAAIDVPREADLAFVIGTSLQVAPFSRLPMMVDDGVPRVLMNLEAVGDLGYRGDDVLMLGDIDESVRELAEELGWIDELEALWREVGGTTAEQAVKKSKPTTRDEKLEAEIEKITGQVDKSLKMSQKHEESVKKDLGNDQKEKSGQSEQSDKKENIPLAVTKPDTEVAAKLAPEPETSVELSTPDVPRPFESETVDTPQTVASAEPTEPTSSTKPVDSTNPADSTKPAEPTATPSDTTPASSSKPPNPTSHI